MNECTILLTLERGVVLDWSGDFESVVSEQKNSGNPRHSISFGIGAGISFTKSVDHLQTQTVNSPLQAESLLPYPHPHNERLGMSTFFLLNVFSDFIPFFSQFGSQSHPYFFNYPPMLLRSTAYTSSLAARRGSSDPESDTPSPSRILSPVCRNSRSIPVAESLPSHVTPA